MSAITKQKTVLLASVLIFIMTFGPAAAKSDRGESRERAPSPATNADQVSKSPARSAPQPGIQSQQSGPASTRSIVTRVTPLAAMQVHRSPRSASAPQSVGNRFAGTARPNGISGVNPPRDVSNSRRSSPALATETIATESSPANPPAITSSITRIKSAGRSVNRSVQVVLPHENRTIQVSNSPQRKVVVKQQRTIFDRVGSLQTGKQNSLTGSVGRELVQTSPLRQQSQPARSELKADSAAQGSRESSDSAALQPTGNSRFEARSGTTRPSSDSAVFRRPKSPQLDRDRQGENTPADRNRSDQRFDRSTPDRNRDDRQVAPGDRNEYRPLDRVDRAQPYRYDHDGWRHSVQQRIVWPRQRHIVWYHWGPQWTYRWVWPAYHHRYMFVSIGGFWPVDYTCVRYYWYGWHPWYWYGCWPVPYEVAGDTHNYYTYNYYGADTAVPAQTGGTVYDEGTPNYEAFRAARERMQAQPAEEPAAQTTADTYFDEAVKAFEQADYKLAADSFAAAIELEPNDIILPFAYAQALFAEYNYSQAAAVLRQALSNLPADELSVFYPRGLYLEDQTLFDQIEQLRKLAELNDADADLQFLLGYHLLGVGKFEEAMQSLEKADTAPENEMPVRILRELIQKIKAKQADNPVNVAA